MTCTALIGTRHGPARLILDRADDPSCVLVLGHGAGGGAQAPDLAALAARLPRHGVSVLRIEQPWRVAGRRVATAPARLDEGWLDCLRALDLGGLPLVVGGRSAGARVACRTASDVGAVAVLALAFPLHPPGRPERSRAEELKAPQVPVLVVQGSRDAFGGPLEVAAAAPAVQVVELGGTDHSLLRRHRDLGRGDSEHGDSPQIAALIDAVLGLVATISGGGRESSRPPAG